MTKLKLSQNECISVSVYGILLISVKKFNGDKLFAIKLKIFV